MKWAPLWGSRGGKIWTPSFSDSLTPNQPKSTKTSILAQKILRADIPYCTITAALFGLLICFIIASIVVVTGFNVIPWLPFQSSRDVTRCSNASHCQIRYSTLVFILTLKSWKKYDKISKNYRYLRCINHLYFIQNESTKGVKLPPARCSASIRMRPFSNSSSFWGYLATIKGSWLYCKLFKSITWTQTNKTLWK